ncbi:MAG TPA: DnaD domain protein, partial [Candidatus Fournierella merdigallinarum]|nr:DnaD domain protein [Candidatus Fournierella merdigallinarum]
PPPAEKAPPLTADQLRLAALRDPTVSMLAAEAQACLGRALGQKEVQRVVSLYVNEGIPAEVILLCAAYNAAGGRCSVAQLERELDRWSQAGVCTGEDAERHLKLLAARRRHEEAVAGLLGLAAESLTQADKNCVRRWYEEYRYDDAMVAEAALHAGANRDVKYLNGILKSWHGKGWRTPADARGAGGLEGSNVRVDRAAPAGDDLLLRANRRPLRLKRED